MTNLITNFIFFVLFILDFTKQAINLDKVCPKYNYDSLQYVCNTACSKKGYNTCYSETDPISIYTFDSITLPSPDCNDDKGEIITELSGDRKLLVSPQCAKDEFDYSDVDKTKYTITTGNPIPLSATIANNIIYYKPEELSYYTYACLDGKYERACDYAANICALTLYYTTNNNPFCQIIDNLDSILDKEGIL